jgi:CRISPR-associated protein Cas6
MLCMDMKNAETINQQQTFVELCFGITGQTLPADHGYGLYSAIAHRCPTVHEQEGISILTIAGERDYQGKIHLSKGAQLKIRLPYEPDTIGQILPLAGQTLKVGTHEISLSIPQIFPLRPFDKLRSRLVTIKKFQEPELFLEAVKRQMATLEIAGNAVVLLDAESQPMRKAIKIKQYSVVGFSLAITNLSDEDSIKLQAYGLGGKRRMGCGVFTAFPGDWRFQDA